MFSSLASLTLLFAQISLTPAPARPAEMQDPLRRDTPQSSVVAFLEACRVNNYTRAARYLDLRRVPAAQRSSVGIRVARQLEEILDRDTRFDVGALSRDPSGDTSDGLGDPVEAIASYQQPDGRTEAVQLERITLPSGLNVWMFSAATVESIPHIAAMEMGSPIEPYLPDPLVNWLWLDTPIWRWLALGLLIALGVALSGLLSRLALAIIRVVTAAVGPGIAKSSIEIFVAPMRLLVVIAVFRAGMEPIAPSALLRLWLNRGVALSGLLAIVWVCMALVDLALVKAKTWVMSHQEGYSFAAFQLGSRILKIGIVFTAVTALIGSWGYNTGTIWAGLGVGGLALALAAQKTIENLFGGVSVISDRPVAIGDLCRFGDRTGIVEDIGLRSTRLRTPERTLVTVPNAQFSAMTLENFSRRDKILFKTLLSLRRDTTPTQLRDILAGFTEMLRTDPRIDVGNFPVRFTGVGQWSLDVEIFAHVKTVEPEAYLSVQQELLLRLLEIIRESGAALALPTQITESPASRGPAEP